MHRNPKLIRAVAALMACVIAAAVVPLSAVPATAASSSIVFSGGPGTSAPPSKLGPYTMTAFGTDSQPSGTAVNGVDGPTGALGFSPALRHDLVGGGWATWSNGYAGDVYWAGSSTITLRLPKATRAFYFYAEPVQFQTFTISATSSDGATSGAIPVAGQAGAQYFGFYSTDATALTAITVTAADPAGFAVGEFGVSKNAFTVNGSLPVLPSSSQDTHAATPHAVCSTVKLAQYKAEGYAVAAGFDTIGAPDAASLLRHFLGGSVAPVDLPDGSRASKDLLKNSNFIALNKAVQNEILSQLHRGDATVKLAQPPLSRIPLYSPTDLHWAFGGTQGIIVTGTGHLAAGTYTGTLKYKIEDSYGFSVNDHFYGHIGDDMRYLQTVCGAPQRSGGARWFPDSVTITVKFSLTA